MNILKKALIILIIVASIITNISNVVYATNNSITKEEFKKAMEEFETYLNSKADEEVKITVEDEIINMLVKGIEYNINYNLESNPTFITEAKIIDGMSYEEYNEETGKLIMPIICIPSIAKLKGVAYENSLTYFTLAYTFGMAEVVEGKNKYIVTSDELEVEGKTVINQREFGKYVIEYTKNLHENPIVVNDKNGIFELKIEIKDSDDKSCTLKSTLTLNMEKDFSVINDIEEDLKDNIQMNEILKDVAKDKEETLKAEEKEKQLLAENEKKAEELEKQIQNGMNEFLKDAVKAKEETLKAEEKEKQLLAENEKQTEELEKQYSNNITKMPNAGYQIDKRVAVLYGIIIISTLSMCVLYISSKKINNKRKK